MDDYRRNRTDRSSGQYKHNRTNYPVHADPARRTIERQRPAQTQTLNLPSFALWSLVLVLFIVYLGGYIYSYISRPKIIETTVVFGSVDQTPLFDGVIIRDETVYNADSAGIVVYKLNNYDRVKKDGVVCSIQEADKVEEMEESLTRVDKNIISIQEDNAGFSLFEEDVQVANSQIKKIADELSFSLSENNVQTLYTMKDKVNQTLGVRNQILLTENRGSLKSLVQERVIIENQLSSAKHPISSLTSGIVCYLTDGFENLLTIDKLDTISKEQARMKVDYEELTYNREVYSGDPVFKIIKSNDWYIAAYIDASLTAGWAKNEPKTIYIKNGDKFNPLGTTIYNLESDGEHTYVVFKTNKELIDYLEYRTLSFRVEQGVVEGLKIPNSTIVDKTLLKIPSEFVFEDNGRKAVTKKVLDKEEIIPITVNSEDDTYCYVIHDYNNLRYGDTLISGNLSMQINESENIKGVYVTNSGAAVFKKIVLGGNYSENATHTILDPTLNTGLKVQDRIVTDAKYIEDKQLVY